MGKRTFSSEAAYAAGLALLAVGTAFMEKAGFGMSMVVAPAYILHVKISEYLPFFTFGMSEYVFQALLLAVLSAIAGRVKRAYPFSFVTAFVYGMLLDAAMSGASLIPLSSVTWRIAYFAFGMTVCAMGVALLFRTYLPPEAYELLVKEVSLGCGKSVARIKTIYDIASCLFAVLLSFIFFGFDKLVGVSWGTAVCAVLNGPLIGLFGRLYDRLFVFRDRSSWRPFFEK